MPAKRRPKGEGSITKLPNGSLKMTITLGVGVDGKQKRRSVTAKTKAELMHKVSELKVASGKAPRQEMYFKQLFEHYLAWQDERITEGTKLIYRTAIPLVFEPFYDYRVDKITPEMIDAVLDNLKRQDGKPMAKATVQNLRGRLSAVFNFAVSKGVIAVSPMKQTKLRPKPSNRINTLTIPSEDQMKELLLSAKEYDKHNTGVSLLLYPLFLLAVSTGMRIGEILDLDRVKDINVEKHTISISSQLTRFGSDYPLKTQSSYRVIYVQPDVLNTVLELVPYSEKTTKLWAIHDRQVTSMAAGMQVHKFLSKSTVVPKGFTFHGFRHYHATYLLLNGINVKEVSKRLGHSSISTTLELYAHWIPEMDESAANTIGKGFIF